MLYKCYINNIKIVDSATWSATVCFSRDCILYLQPEWSKRDKVIPLIVDYVMAKPKRKVSLQTHKYLNIP